MIRQPSRREALLSIERRALGGPLHSWDDPQEVALRRELQFVLHRWLLGLRPGESRICRCKTESGQGVGKGSFDHGARLGWWMFLVVTVDGHVWPCGSSSLMPERRTTARRPTAQAQIRQLHIVKSIAVYGAANPECGLRTGWGSASLRFDRASDNIHRRTLR